jgi:hypothetical protein
MDVVLIGNTHPAIVMGEPDEDGNVRVAVFGGEQTVASHDLYKTDGSEAFPATEAQPAATATTDQQQTDPLANAQTQPATASGA